MQPKTKKLKYAIFVISHGRSHYDKLPTLKCLEQSGYTGDLFVVIDDEDEEAPIYMSKYGDKVIQFSKKEYDYIDTCDLIPEHTGTPYVRNAMHDIAKKLGYEYYAVFDDDYTSFRLIMNRGAYLRHAPVNSMDRFIDAMFEMLKDTGADCCALSQIGDFIGGLNSGNINTPTLRRKVMNTFFCSTEKPLSWVGRTNEDVSLYVCGGIRGQIYITNYMLAVVPSQTQALKGGLTDFYRSYGTYNKSMYTVIQAPSAVKISVVGDKHPRIHHYAQSVNYTPCILDERHRKF